MADDLVSKALGLFSGPDYLSTGEVASPTNWGNPELASDFFKADRAARLAREVLAQEPARDIPLPPRRPPPVSEETVSAAPLLARASLRVKEEEPAVPSVDEKFMARAVSGPDLTERDRDLIIRTIAAETSGKSPEEAQAIAQVILNRIQSGKFGASPEAVLFAKNQFEPWSNPKGANYPMRFAPTSARYGMGKAALEAALGGDDITRGALNFWGPKAQSALGRKPPKWASEMPDYFDLGDTRFHRPRADGGEAEGYDKGGKAVSKALKAVSELFDSPGMTKWREKSVIPASSMEDRYFTGTSKDKDFANFNVGRHGAWFTKDPAEASSYALQNDSKGYRRDGWDMVPVNTADRVIPAFLRAENPYRGPLPEMVHAENYKKAQSDWFDTLRAQGHDAWMPENSPNLAVILKNPSDIKSALSNSGDFDLAAPRIDRAEGGEVEGYAGGGDVVAKALAALRGGNKVFPKPQRMFSEGARPPGGEYINAATGEAITGQKPARAVIGVTPEGKPVFLVDPEQVDVTGSPGKGSTKTKTNLFKQQAGWKWIDAPEGYESVPTIVSAENRGQHYYGLGADFPKGVDLERYADAPSEPRLRPTTQGNVYPGEQVGSIDVRGREHPVYDMLTIRNLLAGTGAGTAGAAALPEAEEGYAEGGEVDAALHMVRRHFDGSDGSFVDLSQEQEPTGSADLSPYAAVFAGAMSKTANQDALDDALEMQKYGHSPEKIRRDTGWFEGADGQWRYEIPDYKSKLNPSPLLQQGRTEPVRLGDLLDHPELYAAYPKASEIPVDLNTNPKAAGSFNAGTGDMRLSAGDPANMRSTALHELQHFIQNEEGFARGANTTFLREGTPAWDLYQKRIMAMKKVPSLEKYAKDAGFDNIEEARPSWEAYAKDIKSGGWKKWDVEAQKSALEEAYRRSAGEVEARNVQTRRDMDPSSLKMEVPWKTQSIPNKEQLVSFRDKGPAMIAKALKLVRGKFATDGYVNTAKRMRDVIASIDPEAGQLAIRNQDVEIPEAYREDPELAGRMWANAVQAYRNREEGSPELRAITPSLRDEIGGMIAGDGGGRNYASTLRNRAADLAVGSTGLPDSGTLGFGLADLPMVTGVPLTVADMARDVGQGDYGTAAASAALPAALYARGPLSAAGRRAVEIAKEYAKPAAATAAGVAGLTAAPDEAEAAKLSKAFNIMRTAERPAESRIISQAGEHGFFQPQTARERDPRLWHPISNTVLSRPLGEMTAEHQLLSGLPERKFIRPEDLEGASLIPALGDRTMGGGLLRGVNDIEFKNPVNMQAGHSFMYGPAATGPDRAIWASDPGVITILSNKAKAASEAGFDPYLSYVAMGSRSGDYSHHMTDALREMFAKSKVKKDVVDEFDRQMRENTANKWAAYSDWPGLKSKNLEEYLYSTGPGKARTKMAELMGQGQFQKAGMPEVGAARFAITDPELLHAADYSAGRTIARLDPMGRKITDPAVPHKTYKHQLAAHPEEGYVGGFEYDIPFEVMNKEFIDSVIAKDAAKAANPSQLAYTYRMNMPRVDFTPQVVDRLSKFLEMKKMGLIP